MPDDDQHAPVVRGALDMDAQRRPHSGNVLNSHSFLSLGAVNRVWNERIDKVISQSIAERIHSRFLYN